MKEERERERERESFFGGHLVLRHLIDSLTLDTWNPVKPGNA